MKYIKSIIGNSFVSASVLLSLCVQHATAGEMASQKWVNTRIEQQATNTQEYVRSQVAGSEARTTDRINAVSTQLTEKIDDDIETVTISLSRKIDEEKSRAESAEVSNRVAIASESVRAKNAEEANASSINAEKIRAQSIESGLGVRISSTEEGVSGVQADVNAVKVKIPSAASAVNQLADKNYVIDAIRQNAETFKGSYTNWASVPSNAASYIGGTPIKNDYLTVQDASDFSASNTGTWLFRYSGSTWEASGKAGWLPEYKISTEPMTGPQIAALNSGITAAKVGQIHTNTVALATVDPKIAAAIAAMEVFTTNAIAQSAASLAIGSKQLETNNVYCVSVGSGKNQALIAIENKTVNALIVSNASNTAIAMGVTNNMLMVWDGSSRYFNKNGHAVYCSQTNFVWLGLCSHVTNGVDYFNGYFYVLGTKIQPSVAAVITNSPASRNSVRLKRSTPRDSSNPPYQPSGWSSSDTSSVGTYWYPDENGNPKSCTVHIDNNGKISGLPDSYLESPEGKAALYALEEALRAKEMVRQLSENVVTDLKWDSQSKKLTWTKKGGTSSSGDSSNSAELDYKLNKDNNDFWLQINGSACGDTVARAKGDNQTIEFADSSSQKLRVKIADEGGLKSTTLGLSAKTYDNSGIKIGKNGIAVKTKNKGGLGKDSDGLYVTLQNNSALDLGSTGLAVLTASNGGIEKKSNNGGLAIKVKSNKGISSDSDGIYVNVAADGGIDFDNGGGLEIKVDPDGGLFSSSDGLAAAIDYKTISLDDESSLSVIVGDGLTVDDGGGGIKVNAGDGIEINDEKVKVKPASDGCINVDSDGVDVKVADDGALDTNGGLAVKVGSSITTDNNALIVKCDDNGAIADGGNGIAVSTDDESITVDNKSLTVKVYEQGGIQKSSDGLELKIADNSGLLIGTDGLKTCQKNGIMIDSSGNLTIQAKDNGGIGTDDNGVYVVQGNGIATDANGVNVKLDGNSGMTFNNNALKLASVNSLCGWNGSSWVQIQPGGGAAVDDKSICSNSEHKLEIKGWASQGTCEADLYNMLIDDNDSNRSSHKLVARVNGDLHYVPIGNAISGDNHSIAKDDSNKFVLKGAGSNSDKLLCSGGTGDNQWLTIGDGLQKDGTTLKGTGAGDDHSITVNADKKSVIKGASENADKLLQSGGSGDNKWLEIGDGLQVESGTLKSSVAGDDHSITVNTDKKAVIKGAADNSDKLLQSGGSGDNKWLSVSNGLTIDGNNIKVLADSNGPINVTSDGVDVLCDEETITVKDNELTVSLDPDGGLYSGDAGIGIDCGDGIDCDSDGVKVKLAENSGMEIESSSSGLKLAGTNGKLCGWNGSAWTEVSGGGSGVDETTITTNTAKGALTQGLASIKGYRDADAGSVLHKTSSGITWQRVSCTTNVYLAGAGIRITDNGGGYATISALDFDTQESGEDSTATLSVVTDVRYNETTHKFQKKTRTIVFRGTMQSESEWIDVFNAVSHKSEHEE